MRAAVALSVLALAGQTAPADRATGAPPALVGVWEVEHVAVDMEDLPMRRPFRPDEPALVGRTLVIDRGEVKFEQGKEVGCRQVIWRARQTTWGYLFAKGFLRSPVGGRSPRPTPEDFRLDIPRNQEATAYSVCPVSGRDVSPFPLDTWVALQATDRLAFHLDTQSLLLLRRRSPSAKPEPAFDCGKATSPTETTICGSFDLSSWDRSVALAFRQALEQRPAKAQELRQSQRAWLRERDACGDDASCISDRLWRRVAALGEN